MKKLFALICCLLVIPGSSSQAYGPEGHKIIGGIADQRLANTPTGARVSELLDGYTLQEVSVIADTIKQWDKPGVEDQKVQRYFSSHPKIAEELRNFWKANPPTDDEHSAVPSHHWFHYTDVPLAGNEKYADARTGRSQWDIVQMMRYCIEVLEGKIPETNGRKITRPIAVILLAHFVGDIHQPLHVGAEYFDAKGKPANPNQVKGTLPDEGGNTLRIRVVGGPVRKHDPKFHGFWDMDSVLANLPVFPDSMPKEQRQAEMDAAETALISRLAKTEPKNCSSNAPVEELPEVWADEILPLAREAHRRLHYEQITPKLDHERMVADGEIVEKEGENNIPYSQWAASTVLVEMHKAGWRLADLLTRTLQPNESKTAP